MVKSVLWFGVGAEDKINKRHAAVTLKQQALMKKNPITLQYRIFEKHATKKVLKK